MGGRLHPHDTGDVPECISTSTDVIDEYGVKETKRRKPTFIPDIALGAAVDALNFKQTSTPQKTVDSYSLIASHRSYYHTANRTIRLYGYFPVRIRHRFIS